MNRLLAVWTALAAVLIVVGAFRLEWMIWGASAWLASALLTIAYLTWKDGDTK